MIAVRMVCCVCCPVVPVGIWPFSTHVGGLFLTKDNLSRLAHNIEKHVHCSSRNFHHRARVTVNLLYMIIALPPSSYLSYDRETTNVSSHKKKCARFLM